MGRAHEVSELEAELRRASTGEVRCVLVTADPGVGETWTWLFQHDQVIPAGARVLAAVYEVTPLKNSCLRSCRNPALYLMHHCRRGDLGGLRLGLGRRSFQPVKDALMPKRS